MRFLLFFYLFASSQNVWASEPITIGSKSFTEGVVLGEVLAQALRNEKLPVKMQAQLGGTRLVWNALRAGNIDAYVEYSGTLFSELVPNAIRGDLSDLKMKLAEIGIGISRPLGFNNTYGFGMLRTKAQSLGIKKISDLPHFPNFRAGLSSEFLNRADGWPGAKKTYSLPQSSPRGMEHAVSYRALKAGDIDFVDVYTTDGDIKTYDIYVLNDDLNFFPRYDALVIYRLDLLKRAPQALKVFTALEDSINQDTMTKMNAAVTMGKKKESRVASEFLKEHYGFVSQITTQSRFQRIIKLTKEHLSLVGISLLFALLLGIPLGILSAKYNHFGLITLQTVGIFQTIPALALLVVLIRPLNAIGLRGIGALPAIIALFLYSLLPIVRNTFLGFTQFPEDLKESMHSLGISAFQRIRYIELPLALPAILSGVKTAAVINIGFATLGALVGAGGYGQPILTGIRLDDYSLILEGAIPSAVLAVLVERIFTLSERVILPKPLRKS